MDFGIWILLLEQSVRITPIAITGTAEPKDNAYSKTFLYRPPDKDLRAHRGEVYACLSLASPDPSLDQESLANQTLTCFSDSYFGQKQGSVLDALSKATNQAQARALELTHREGGQIPLDFSLVAVVVWGKAAFVNTTGGGFAALFRGGELLPETANRLFSEELKDKDVIVLATPLFATRIGQEKIAESLCKIPFEELSLNLKEIVSQKEEQSRLAAIFLKAEIEEVPGEEEVIEILEVPKQEPMYTPLLRAFQNVLLKFQFPSTKFQISTNFQIQNKLKTIWSFFHRKREPEVYLKEQKPGGRGKKFALVSTLVVLLVISILTTRWWNRRNERNKEVRNLLIQAKEKIAQGEQAISVNKERAKKLLDEAQDSLGQVAGMQVSQKEIEGLQTKMGEILQQAYNTEKLEPQLIADLGLKIDNGEFKELIKLGGKLYSLDAKSGKFVEVDLENESKLEILRPSTTLSSSPSAEGSSLGVEDGASSKLLAGYLDSLYTFDPEQGIVEINRCIGSAEVAIPIDLNWKEISGLKTFLGNLYLLDPPNNRIFKYIAIETGFSKFINYFSQNVNLSNATGFTIDGAIYLLFGDGRVEKYLGGAREEFALSGLYPPFNDASCIYTNSDAEKLYIVSGNFILIFGKNGVYEKRLQIAGVSQVVDLVVEENEQKGWVLAGGKIYEIGL